MRSRFSSLLAVPTAFAILTAWGAFAAPQAEASSGRSGEPLLAPGLVMTFHLVPVEYWDDPHGPWGHELSAGRVFLYRVGSFVPEIEEAAETPILIPPGDWIWSAEAPGYASTFTQHLSVSEGTEHKPREMTVPVVPACRFVRSQDRRWERLERVDVVSLSESAVYPMVRESRREWWVPQGDYLAYGVQGGALTGISEIARCRANETVTLEVPEPPAAGKQSLLVTVELPESMEPAAGGDVLTEVSDVSPLAGAAPLVPAASLWQGSDGAFFFLGLPADAALELAVRHPELRTVTRVVDPLGGSAREIDLGALEPRRSVEVAIDYRPAREHAIEEVTIQECGRDRAADPAPLLAKHCREPFARLPIAVGVKSYRFELLDDGQYLVSARIDDEEVPGLGRNVMPYLDPESSREPPPESLVRLEELEIHGQLLRHGEAVPGVVSVSPWSGVSGIPSIRAATDDDLRYQITYFGRYPEPGEATHLPEPLADRNPADLPGLYCCFELAACSEAGACRTFNVHSTLTGSGELDLELPGDEKVDVTVVDSVSGEPIPAARVLVRPSLALHFDYGDVYWEEPAGAEPDGLDTGKDGHVVWLPPNPGHHRLAVYADGFEDATAEVNVPKGGSESITVELDPDPADRGTYLALEDGTPALRAALIAFDENGRPRAACNARVNSEGYVKLRSNCERELTFLLVHPRAALQTFTSEELARSGTVEAAIRPSFPPRIRVVDSDGEPLANTFIALRLGDLTITPDDLFGGGTGSLPFQPTTNARGEVVLQGVDTDTVRRVEVSPWVPYEPHWVPLRAGERRVVDLVAVASQ